MKKISFIVTMILCANIANAQYSTSFVSKIIDNKSYNYIVGETSGERAKNNAADMASYELYNRNFDNLKESECVAARCKEYGLNGVEIRRYKSPYPVWAAVKGSLWETSPKIQKLTDIGDIPASLAPNSQNADITAELIWVGDGNDEDFKALDVKGKIAVGSNNVWRLHNAAVAKGAVGVISIFNPRPQIDNLQIPNSSISKELAVKTKSFAFQMVPRHGYELRDRLKRGDKITVRAQVETKTQNIEYQSPTCFIEGSDPSKGEIIFSAHLFEGYTKLGANDNMSGSVVLLEVARTLNTLIEKGLIEKPKRTLRFIWGDEFSGIIPWANENSKIMDKALFNINLDMVGIGLSDQASYYHLHRTTMANSHYSNDLVENIFRYIGETNQNSILIGEFIDPIIAPTGSLDPFYYCLTSHYGASDHEVFNDWGIQVPSVMMITWPDENYHTSTDRIEKLDATQLKRAAVIAATVAFEAAVADENGAIKIGNEVAGNSLRRMATIHNKVSNFISNANKSTIQDVLKNALEQVDAVAIAEKRGIASIKELAPESTKLTKYIAEQSSAIDGYAEILKSSLKSAAMASGAESGEITLSSEEIAASKIYPKSTAKVRELGYAALHKAFDNDKSLFELKIGNGDEAARLTQHGDVSIYDIKKMLIAQSMRQVKISDLIKFMNLLKDKGLVTLENK
ncbi:MAG: M28 family peptidase [Rikenellaceae bacterium]